MRIRTAIRIVFVITVFYPLFSKAENDKSFFGYPTDISVDGIQSDYKKLIEKCGENPSNIRLQSEVDWKYNHDEESSNVAEYSCKLKDGVNFHFLKDETGKWKIWKISKHRLDTSVARVVSDLEKKVGQAIKLTFEFINDNMGVEYRFRTNFRDGEIRGSALEPYMKLKPDTLSMKSGSIEYFEARPLVRLIDQTKNTKKQEEAKKTEKLNKSASGI
jgi:hypothetical protein